MTYEKFLLLKIMEESSELAQRASKAIQFGLNETEKNQPFTNLERLQQELNDLLCVVSILNTELISNGSPLLSLDIKPHQVKEKAEKIERYLSYSESLGEL